MMKRMFQNFRSFFDIIGFCLKLTYSTSKKYFFLHIFFDLLLAMLPFWSITITSSLIDYLALNFNVESLGNRGIFELLIYIAAYAAVSVASKAVDSLNSYVESTFNEIMDFENKCKVMKKAANLEMFYFDTPEFFDTLNDVNMNSMMIIMLSFRVFGFLRCIVQLFIALGKTITWNWYMPLIIIISLFPALIVKNKQLASIYSFQLNNMKYTRKLSYLTDISVNRQSAQDIRMYGLASFIAEKFNIIWKTMFSEKKKLVKKYTILLVFFNSIPEIVMSIFLLMLGFSVFRGEITIGDFSLYNGLMGQASTAMFITILSYSQIYDGKIKISNFKKFMELDSEKDESDKLEFDSKNFVIEFRNVSFIYNGKTERVLDNMNFTINSTEKTALVGVNGCGKTTAIKLLLRFYEPTEGKILINGTDIRRYTKESIRKCFSPMFQNYFNYAFRASDDISLSDIECENELEKIKNAAEKSGAARFIEKLDNKYDSFLTREYEDGCELSGGQWQKIALARTFFRNAPVYILDEPSAALDAESEDELFCKFEELYKNSGAILISHRLSNLKNCDKIIVIDGGKVIEEGDHRSLIKDNSKYSHMFNLQAQKYS